MKFCIFLLFVLPNIGNVFCAEMVAPKIGNVLCAENHSVSRYFETAHSLLTTPPDRQKEIKFTFLAERLLRCALIREPTNARCWAYISTAITKRQVLSVQQNIKRKPKKKVVKSALKLMAWSLYLSPSNPEVLTVALQQAMSLQPYWSSIGKTLEQFRAYVNSLKNQLHDNFNSSLAIDWYQRGILFEKEG